MPEQTERLHTIVESGNVIEFFSVADKEHSQICWTAFGAIETNEVIVRAAVAGRSFFRSAPSPLLVPVMADRRFGIDVMDDQVASQLSLELWQEHGDLMSRLAREQGPQNE